MTTHDNTAYVIPADALMCRKDSGTTWHLMEDEDTPFCGRRPALGYFEEDAPYEDITADPICKPCLQRWRKRADYLSSLGLPRALNAR